MFFYLAFLVYLLVCYCSIRLYVSYIFIVISINSFNKYKFFLFSIFFKKNLFNLNKKKYFFKKYLYFSILNYSSLYLLNTTKFNTTVCKNFFKVIDVIYLLVSNNYNFFILDSIFDMNILFKKSFNLSSILKKNLTKKKYFYFFKKFFKIHNIKLLIFLDPEVKKYNYYFFKKLNVITCGLVSKDFKESVFDLSLINYFGNLMKFLTYKIIHEVYLLSLYNLKMKNFYNYINYQKKIIKIL